MSSAFYLLKDKVLDGTKCGPDTSDICVNGHCHVSLYPICCIHVQIEAPGDKAILVPSPYLPGHLPTYLPTYLPIVYLPTYLPIVYQPTYLLIILHIDVSLIKQFYEVFYILGEDVYGHDPNIMVLGFNKRLLRPCHEGIFRLSFHVCPM